MDGKGEAFIPTFYGGRIHIDFSDLDKQEEAYQELVRWINDAPLNARPKLGKKPTFLKESGEGPLVTQSHFRRAKDAVDKGLLGAVGLIRDFGDALVEQLIALRPEPPGPRSEPQHSDDMVVAAADQMRPYVRQLHELTRSVARNHVGAVEQIVIVLEQVLATTDRTRETQGWTPWVYDANKIMCYEAFLGVVATLLAENRHEAVASVLEYAYYFHNGDHDAGRSTTEYEAFNPYVETLRTRIDRQQSQRADLQADYIKEHYRGGLLPLERMMEADLLLYIRPIMFNVSNSKLWVPHSVLYVGRSWRALELFGRMESKRHFERISLALLGSVRPQDFKDRVAKLS